MRKECWGRSLSPRSPFLRIPYLPGHPISARDVLIAAYGKAGQTYMQYFASSVAANFAPVVFRGPSAVARVNGCLVVAAIQQPEIVPALELMVANDNAAVRYYGIKGFQALRGNLLAQGARGRDQMIAALKGQAQKEASPVVLGALCQTIDFSGVSGVPETVLQPARAEARQILLASVAKNLQAVRDGDLPMCAAFSRVMKVVASLGAETRDQERIALLQMLGNVMDNACEAYMDLTESAGKSDEPPTELANLLADCELAITQITARTDSGIRNVFQNRGVNRTDVKLAVNFWVGTQQDPGELVKLGIKKTVPLPRGSSARRATSRPTSRPATRPSATTLPSAP